MRVSEAYQPDRIALSFELFPPKTEASEAELFVQMRDLAAFEPSLVTCTYGAGGSTQTKTLDIIERVRREFNLPVASHLTCVGSTVDDLRRYLTEAWQRGVTNIVALRGDPPKGETQFKAVDGGLRYANELVALIRNEFPQFGIAVAGYPEKHLEAPSLDVDLLNLQRKVAAGADIVVTQLFYDNADFFRFRERCEQLAIRCPIVPGVLPITNLAQIKRITSLCGAKLPLDLVASLEACGDSVEDQFRVGVEFATHQVQGLIDAGVPGVHFYVLNKSAATSQVLRQLTLPERVKKKWLIPAPHNRVRATSDR
ncbi:MAG: methylenetetrahydrofolate reductase [NAD(P)H] [Planctomycetaceae bacterium]|nr:methylenetetrahydrofolate reductase [NAD(P)H] [Planctomycetaceae bacterium]